MLPILLVHGYSTEGKNNSVDKIYGSLPKELKARFGANQIKTLNLSRWISLSDGVMLDDVSYAMDRALKSDFKDLLESGFHVIIHSTGALVVRNWIKKFSPKPCPIQNFVHLAGANFGSGLAHIGQGQISRWKNLLFQGTGVGTRVLDELEFGCSKTLDLHAHFLTEGNDIYHDYQVKEFNIIGSQTLGMLRVVPIRYVKEDSSDNTVRTSASNLNFNYVPVTPKPKASKLTVKQLQNQVNKRLKNEKVATDLYQFDLSKLSINRPEIPFAIAFETAHFGDEIGIVGGSKNRAAVMPLVKTALMTKNSDAAYQKTVDKFKQAKAKTFERASKLKWKITEWDPQQQYEGHAQLIFRIKDQFGNGVEYFDVMLKSNSSSKKQVKLEKLIEDHHGNKQDKGVITFYMRTQKFNDDKKVFEDLMSRVAPLDIEITGYEPESKEIAFVPLNLSLTTEQIQKVMESFKTTIIDITLVRLPSEKVFAITRK
ncbi:MAG: hypothetical protein OQJ89_03310 [Kangiellaceae bacterium]|nr:hypothetical protein [Kangiellaceae bacterium]MCW9015965.1 hypothetical protein [Kangiellaceae bacterium]